MNKDATVIITGDLYFGSYIYKFIENFSFNEIFNDFLDELKSCDIAITNLEAPLTFSEQRMNKTGPSIKSHPDVIEALKYAGFNLLTLANNHIMDYGIKGLSDTINLCNLNNIDFVGVGFSLDEASRPFLKSVGSKKLAFVNFAENEWSTTDGKLPGANPLNPITNYYSIQQAKKDADYVFVIVHGGHERYNLPSPKIKALYRFYIDAGASAVIGHHTHVFSGYEMYNGCPIFYSLGNFIFDTFSSYDPRWNEGYAVKFVIENDNINFRIIPYIQMKENIILRKMNDLEYKKYSQEIKRLNRIIQDDVVLDKHFNHYVLNMKKQYEAFIEPHSNRIIYALQGRQLFPSLLSKKKRLLYRNLIRCESHRELILKILNK